MDLDEDAPCSEMEKKITNKKDLTKPKLKNIFNVIANFLEKLLRLVVPVLQALKDPVAML